MLQLAENNHKHFLPYAQDAYLTGHHLAINKARKAGEYHKDDVKRGYAKIASSLSVFTGRVCLSFSC